LKTPDNLPLTPTPTPSTPIPSTPTPPNPPPHPNILPLIASPLLCLLIMTVIFACKGYWPFDGATTAMGDLYAQGVPFLYNFYDAVHGGSFFYNFLSFAGANFFSANATWVFSPFNLILLIFPREHLYQALDVLLLLRIGFTAAFMALFLRRAFASLSTFGVTLFSTAYALSGYTMNAYLIYPWLDIACFFPLLAWTLLVMRDEKKSGPFMVVLSLMLIMSFYITGMVLLFLLLAVPIYLYLYTPQKGRAAMAARFSLSVAAAVAIASPVVIPAGRQILHSARNNTALWDVMTSGLIIGSIYNKLVYFLVTSVAIAFTVLLLVFIRKHMRDRIFVFMLVSVFCVPLIFDCVNRLWHYGSFIMFPLRYGFVPLFLLCAFGTYFLWLKEKGELSWNRTLPVWARGLLLAAALAIPIYPMATTFSGIYMVWHPAGINLTHNSFLPFLKVFAAFLVSFFIMGFLLMQSPLPEKPLRTKMLLGASKALPTARTAAMFLLLVAQIGYFGLLFFGMSPERVEFKEMDQLTAVAAYDFEDSSYYRVLDKNMLFSSPNANLITGHKSLSHYTSEIGAAPQNLLRSLGYTAVSSNSLDTGGTLFTDSLLCGKYMLSDKELNDAAYLLKKTLSGVFIYQNTFAFPAGVVISDEDHCHNNLPEHPIEAQNMLYRLLSGDDSTTPLFEILELNSVENADYELSYGRTRLVPNNPEQAGTMGDTLTVSGTKKLYLYAEPFNSAFTRIVVRGEPLVTQLSNEINRWYAPNDYQYPSPYKSGLLYLGEFSDETVDVTLEFDQKVTSSKPIQIAALDMEKLRALSDALPQDNIFTTSGKTLTAQVHADKETPILFLPIAYDKGFTAVINGQQQKPISICGGFLGVPLQKGGNEIRLSYIPESMKPCLILSAATLSLLAVLCYASRFHRLRAGAVFGRMQAVGQRGLYICLCILWVLALLAVYALPIFYSIAQLISPQ